MLNTQPKIIKAKYPSKCTKCGYSLEPGDEVVWIKEFKGVYCAKHDFEKPENNTRADIHQFPQKDEKLQLVDKILEKNTEIKKLYDEIDDLKKRIRDHMAVGEILETQLGKVSVTLYKRKAIHNEKVKHFLKVGILKKEDFHKIFIQELKLSKLGEDLFKSENELLKEVVEIKESERFNIYPKK